MMARFEKKHRNGRVFFFFFFIIMGRARLNMGILFLGLKWGSMGF